MTVAREGAKGVGPFCGGLVGEADGLGGGGGGGRETRGGTRAVRRERGQRCEEGRNRVDALNMRIESSRTAWMMGA